MNRVNSRNDCHDVSTINIVMVIIIIINKQQRRAQKDGAGLGMISRSAAVITV